MNLLNGQKRKMDIFDNIFQEMKNENCIYQYLKINLKETGQHYIIVNLVFIFVKNNQTK